MDSQDSSNDRPDSLLRNALVFKGPVTRRGAAAGGAGNGGGSSGEAGVGSTGAAGEDAAAGLGVDEFVDPTTGVDGHQHTEMLALPGNPLNLLDMIDLREQNHLAVREAALRSSDRRSVLLDSTGLEILRQMQSDIERAHFSQAAVGTRDGLAPQLGLSAPGLATHSLEDQPEADERLRADPPNWEELDPEESYSSAARAYAQRQRDGLMALSEAALTEAATDLAALNQAEGKVETLRDIETEHRGNVPRATTLAEEQRTDLAAGLAADLRHRFQESNTRAVHSAAAAQRRRIGLNNMLRGRAPQ